MIRHHSVGRLGFTLIEMMIAMIITLMIVFAMVEAFRWVGDSTTDGRAAIEMLGQIRHARYVLYEDLSRSTVPLDPWKTDAVNYRGGFEYIEGVGSDTAPGRFLVRTPNGLLYSNFNFADLNNFAAGQSMSLYSDLDDILWMTVRNDETPYRGRLVVGLGLDGLLNTADDVVTVIESNLAEVIWWAELNDQPQDVDNDGTITPPQDTNSDGVIDVAGEGGYGTWEPGETFTIRRRVLLIRPDITVFYNAGDAPALALQRIQLYNDISVHAHFDPTTYNYLGLRSNSLGDLTKRCNRVAHPFVDYSLPLIASGPPAVPALGLSAGYAMSPINPSLLPAYTTPDVRGEDVVISNVLGFDLRAWDPSVPIGGYNAGAEIPEGLVPGDPGYAAALIAAAPNIQGYGAFVDLGCVDPAIPANVPLYTAMGNPGFVGGMAARSRLGAGNYVYDPWSITYEKDGHDQDVDGTADEGTDGLDSDLPTGINGPDDIGERETSPPYPYPLQAFQARFRVYESDTRQVRQASQTVKFGK